MASLATRLLSIAMCPASIIRCLQSLVVTLESISKTFVQDETQDLLFRYDDHGRIQIHLNINSFVGL